MILNNWVARVLELLLRWHHLLKHWDKWH